MLIYEPLHYVYYYRNDLENKKVYNNFLKSFSHVPRIEYIIYFWKYIQ